MAITTSCCLNLPPPIPASKSSSFNSKSTTGTQVAWYRNEKWRSQCVLGMACMVIGLEMGNLVCCQGSAIAKDMPLVVESKEKAMRWSDKRACPPWTVNSLETIVPENLPRPSAHRRWETVGFRKNAPAVQVTVIRSNRCFSM